MTMLDVKGLTKTFGTFKALDGVDFEVRKGEVFGFIGPNGAGKSTTIRVLLGLLKRDAGTAMIFGQDVWTDAVAIHERIAYVPGDVNLWPNLTGGEVLDLFASLQGRVNTKRRDELIAKFDLDPTKCRIVFTDADARYGIYSDNSCMTLYLGSLFQVPEWAARISPFGWVPEWPIERMNWMAAGSLFVIAVGLLSAGMVGYRNRDIQ